MRVLRTIAISTALAAAAAIPGTLPAAAGGPTTEHFPACAPIPATPSLQECLDAVQTGSTIIIDTDDAADQLVFIQRPLTLTAAPGTRRPVGTVVITDNLASFTFDVTLRGLTVRRSLGINLFEIAGSSVLLDDLVIGKVTDPLGGLDIEVTKPSSVTVRNTTVHGKAGDQRPAMAYVTEDVPGEASFRVEGSRVDLRGTADGGAGIQLAMEGSGTVHVDIANTAIRDVASCDCGAAAGIAVLARGTVDADVDIVGVTIDGSRSTGIEQRNSLSGAGHLALRVFDTVISHTRLASISLDRGDPGTMTYQGGWNARFRTDSPDLDGFKAGPGGLVADPRYLDRAAGNLRLRSDSPLIDAGFVCTPAGVVGADADGRWRVAGRSADIGAYEHRGGAITGVVRIGDGTGQTILGTEGKDIVCGMGGPDALSGFAGNDWVDGGKGPDLVVGGPGGDRLFGGPDADRLCGQDDVKGNDRLDGGPARDSGRADPGDVRVSVEATGGCAL